MTLFNVFFILCLVMLGFAAVLGLAAVWVHDFWNTDFGPKALWSSIVIFATSVAAAAITRWLG